MDLKLEGHQEVSNLYEGIKNTQSSQITLRIFSWFMSTMIDSRSPMGGAMA